MKKIILLLILLLPTIVRANEFDAIDTINDYKINKDTELIENVNSLAANVTVLNEEIKAEDRVFSSNKYTYILFSLPVISCFILYTLIIKNKEV